MELAQEKLDLIKRIIRSDKKYTNNEDLFDDFFSESYKRSFLIAKTVENPNALEAYLKKIVATSIVVVLKDSGRVRRTKDGFVSSIEQPIEQTPPPYSIPDNKYSDVQISYDVIDLQDGPEDIVIKKETLQQVIDAVSIAHSEAPQKQFMQLYELRYVKGLKQKEIAQALNLSQSEVSKRLLELMEEVKKSFS